LFEPEPFKTGRIGQCEAITKYRQKFARNDLD
jgi:hypothetical protein